MYCVAFDKFLPYLLGAWQKRQSGPKHHGRTGETHPPYITAASRSITESAARSIRGMALSEASRYMAAPRRHQALEAGSGAA